MVYSQVFAIVFVVLSLQAISFNSIGLYVLSKADCRRTNQWVIIRGLSFTNIIVATGWLLRDAENAFDFHYPNTIRNIVLALAIGAYCTRYFTIFLLTIDRLIFTTFPVRHRLLASKYKFAVASIWGIGFVMIIVNSLSSLETWRAVFERYIWLLLDIIFLVIFTVTYTAIYCRSIASNIRIPRESTSNGGTRFKRMVTYMLVAFLACQVFPDVSLTILYVALKVRHKLVFQGFLLFYRLNMFVDPTIYIMLHPNSKKVLLHIVRRIFASRKVHDSSQLQQETAVSQTNEV